MELPIIQNPLANVERFEGSQEDYFAIDAYSSTDLRTLFKERMNPYAVKRQRETPFKDTDATLLGSLIDCRITEPKMVEERYLREPEFEFYPTTDPQWAFANGILEGLDPLEAYGKGYAKPTEKSAKKLLEQLDPWLAFQRLMKMSNQLPIRDDLWKRSDGAIEACRRHKRFPSMVRDAEKQVIFIGEAFGVRWKGMLDLFDGYVVTDIKSTEDWLKIKGNFFQRGYNIQSRLYSWMASVDETQHFYVETCEPHRTKLVSTTQYTLEASGITEDLMKRIAHADATGDWMHTMEYSTSPQGYEVL